MSRLGFGHERRVHRESSLHFLLEQVHCGFLLGFGRLEDELVVHLQNQAAFQPLTQQAVAHAHHGDLDDIRRRALDGRVHRHPLAERADVEIAALQLGQRAPPSEQGGYIALLFGRSLDVIHILFYTRIGGQIGADEFGGLFARHADILRK